MFVPDMLRQSHERYRITREVCVLLLFALYSISCGGEPAPWKAEWASSAAVCVSGGLRKFDLAGASMFKYFLKQVARSFPDSSLFIATYVDTDAHKLSLFHYFWEEFELEEMELGGVYLHKQPPLPAGSKGEFLLKQVIPRNTVPEAIYGMFYLTEQCNALIMEAERRRGKRYDIVFRLRPEVYFHGPSILPMPVSADDKRFFYPKETSFGGFSDRFGYGTREVMMIMNARWSETMAMGSQLERDFQRRGRPLTRVMPSPKYPLRRRDPQHIFPLLSSEEHMKLAADRNSIKVIQFGCDPSDDRKYGNDYFSTWIHNISDDVPTIYRKLVQDELIEPSRDAEMESCPGNFCLLRENGGRSKPMINRDGRPCIGAWKCGPCRDDCVASWPVNWRCVYDDMVSPAISHYRKVLIERGKGECMEQMKMFQGAVTSWEGMMGSMACILEHGIPPDPVNTTC